MRNMKRALSLVLAMVMLLGMLTIPTGAASTFADADQIVNTEAVDITAGMGLFAGSDGKFNPKGTVTRAQMATIIVKMKYGSDFNADSFKGAGNPFPDTAGFEGGWAEGYINACFQMGVVKGYGDGTFKPGNQVTTAEAVTMIINALKVDAGEGEWPNTVMAKATEMKLFGDLKPAPATNTALIRDQLAVIVLEGLQYSPSGSNTYTYTTPGGKTLEFPSLEDAMTTVGVENAESLTVTPADDTLAKQIYRLKIETGFVTDNQATGADYTLVGDVDFDVETGLDMIGHYVSVYYQEPKSGQSVDAYKVYTVVDESKAINVSEDITNSKDFKAAFGRSYEPAESVLVFEDDYRISEATAITGSYTSGSVADAGTYIINENKIVAYLKPAAEYASYISSISEFDGETTYMLGYQTIAEEDIVLYPGAAKGDIVTYVKAKDQYVLEPVDPMKGTITKTGKNTDGQDVLTINGQDYVAFGAANNETDRAELTVVVDAATFKYGEQYVVYITGDDRIVGWKLSEGGDSEIDVNKIVYAKGAFQKTLKDSYGISTIQYVLQAVNTQGEEVHYVLAEERPATGVTLDGNFDWENGPSAYTEGFYVIEDYDDPTDPNNKEAKKAGIKTVSPVGLKTQAGTALDNGWTYAEDLFYGANRWGGSSIKIPASTSNNHVCTTACTRLAGGSSYHKYDNTDKYDKNTFRTYYSDATQFLMIYGDKGEQLKCAAGGDGFSLTLTGSGTFTLPMLFTEDDNGFIQVVMTVILKDPDALTANNPIIYVADSKPMGTAPGGDLYQAYVAKTAAPIEIVVRTGTAVTAGFKSNTVDEDGRYNLSTSGDDSAYVGMVLTGVGAGGTINAHDPNYISGTEKMDTPSNTSAKSAKIVDLRSEENIEESGVGTITTLDQLRTLINNKYVVNFDCWTDGSTTHAIYITSTYKTPMEDVEVYVINSAGKAGSSTVAYSTADGSKSVIALTEDSDVEGFATMAFVNQAKYLVASEGDKYWLDAAVTGMTADGSNVAVATDKGSFTVTGTTVIAKTNAGITDPASLKAAYDKEVENGGNYTVSAIVVDGKATFFIITECGDVNVSEGSIIKLTEKAEPTGGTDTIMLADGTPHDIKYTKAVYDVQAYADVVETDEYYYTATKNAQGEITLTFAYNWEPKAGDVIFVPDTVKAGDVVEGYVVSEIEHADKRVLVATPSNTYYLNTSKANGTKGTTGGRFWIADGSSLTAQAGIYYGDYTCTYHDKIAWDSDTETLTTEHADGHTGYGKSCGYAWDYSCGYADGKREKEAAANLTVAENAKIIDLTGKGYTSVADLGEIMTQTQAGNAVVNIYVPNGTKNTGTAQVIIVLPPKENFTANCIVDVLAPEHGTVTVNKETAAVGDSVKVTATPEYGYKLSKILVDGKAINSSFFTAKSDIHTVTAEFVELDDYDVNVDPSSYANGDVEITSVVEGKFYGGDEVTITATPDSGYKLTQILVNGEPLEITGIKATFTVTGDAVITVVFEVCNETHTVTVGACEHGTVSVDKTSGMCGDTVTVTATPDAGYKLLKVQKDGEDIEGTTFNITGNHIVTATFGKLYGITVGECEYGEITMADPKGYAVGETVTVTVTADDSFEVEQVTHQVDGGEANVIELDANGQYTFTADGKKHTFEATFLYQPANKDVIMMLENIAKNGEKTTAILAGSTANPEVVGKVVNLTADVYNTTVLKSHQYHFGVYNTSLQIRYLIQDASSGNSTVKGHFAYHEAITAVDTAEGTFTMGGFTSGAHKNAANCHWYANGPHSYKGEGYTAAQTSKDGCESANECADTLSYSDSTLIYDTTGTITLTGNVGADLQTIMAACAEEKVMISAYEVDGTATMVMVQKICPKDCDLSNS